MSESWGESAGAVSVGLHLIIKHGYLGCLFSGAIMVLEFAFCPRISLIQAL
jgi:hypothetical protein